jgi:myosin protein heavy chain
MSEAPTRRRRKVADDGSAPSSSSAPVKSSAKNQQYKPDIVEEVKVDSLLFVPDKEEEYVKAKAIAVNGNKVTAVIEETNTTADFDIKSVFLRNPSNLDGIEDMARLSYLSEPAVLENLRFRYAQNKIYTYSGLFLVAVNPYKMLPIYTNETIQKHVGKRRKDIEPHVYTVSDVAYRQMLTNQINQSMLVTGESGAGKTENTKRVIQYLTAIAGANSGGGKLEQQLLQTNPLLEAFGNAKTLRNNNSSRFGKFIEIDFNSKGFIAGTKIDHYLLETTRVCSQHQDERNFHIFYQITADAESRKKYFLRPASDYNYLSKSGCLVVEGVNDEKEFKDTIESMKIIGMNVSEIDSVLTTVAAILHLGNIEFVDNHDDQSVVKDRDALQLACKLLGVDDAILLDGFQRPILKVGNQSVQKHVTAKEARANRDSLVKSMYLRLFEWLVNRINQSLVTNEKVMNFIGVLDIAGFEIFEDNSFEQLSINFTNEKLQQFFNNHMFKKEQEEYAEERIQWTFQDFGLDLQPTIDLIEAVPYGILDILNDVSKFTGATDENFCNQVIKTHDKKPVFSRFKFDQLSFIIKHYAGDVTYNTRGWLVKNVDPLNDDCRYCMQKSSVDFFKKMFSTPEDLDQRMRSTKKSTVAYKYTAQLTKLMENLRRQSLISSDVSSLMK